MYASHHLLSVCPSCLIICVGPEQLDHPARCADYLCRFSEQLQLIQTTEDGTQSFGTGTPWAGGELKYCFHSHISSELKEQVKIALEQTQQVLPCLKFTDVGLKREGNGQAETSGGSAECNESPAVFITSFNDGCWSYVGELSNSKSQGFNLGPGCDSLGTVMHGA